MPISHTHRCIFVHVPKCGGTSIEAALDMHADWRHEDRSRMFGRISSSDLLACRFRTRFLQHLTWQELCRAVPAAARAGYRSFAVVRHPLRRLESAWLRPDRDLVEEARWQGLRLEGARFTRFVERALRLDHPHVRPQVEFLVDGRGAIALDQVLRFERFEQDAGSLLARFGAGSTLEHRNPPLRARTGIEWPHDLMVQAVERYREDFERLGYEP